ncbi:ABC transporter substrate-binding protein [Desulfatitalea tepidiphila]|uniref:ABC transporter substrate-binding protein n=1 Tax=Desulfatitalea tepidiphila TaxID=1185843 RepID=UPI0006B604EC|nr:ABC transporter substrate-binding protein [Desulfatitalea tepidiphila]
MKTWLAFLLALLLGAGPAAADPPLKVGTWKTAQTIQPFFYEQFLSGEAAVQVFPFTNPADQKTALLAGSLDMCGTTIAHAIHSAAQGQPVVVVAALCHKCSALVVRKASAIATAGELKGRKIGYVPGTMHEILLREVLTRHRLNPEQDVRLIRVDFFDMGLALARGGIDAFLSGEPFPTLAVHEGYGRILDYPYYDDTVGTINAGMLVTRQILESHPERVLQLVHAHARAAEFLNRHPDQWLARAAAFGTEPAVLKAAAANMELAWEMDEAFVQRAKALGARMQALRMIERQPDYDRLFDLQFVKRVKAER